MKLSLGSTIIQRQMADLRDLIRRPGLLLVTAIAVLLIFLFIVFPIGSVLIKSFTVSYPTVTIAFNNVPLPRGRKRRKRQTIPCLAVLKEIQGIEETRLTSGG